MPLAWLVISCDPPKSSDDKGETRQFIAANLPRNETVLTGTFKPDYYRSHFVTFSLRAGLAPKIDYRIGAKLASQAAPTAAQLNAATAAITRTLSSTNINIYLPFHIQGTLFDAGVTKDMATAQASALTPGGAYKIYVTPADGSGQVTEVLSITTDSEPTATAGIYGLPPQGFEYTIKAGEPFLLFGVLLDAANIFWQASGSTFTTCATTGACSPKSSNYGVDAWLGSSGRYILAGNSFSFDGVEPVFRITNITTNVELKMGKFIPPSP